MLVRTLNCRRGSRNRATVTNCEERLLKDPRNPTSAFKCNAIKLDVPAQEVLQSAKKTKKTYFGAVDDAVCRTSLIKLNGNGPNCCLSRSPSQLVFPKIINKLLISSAVKTIAADLSLFPKWFLSIFKTL